MSQPARAWLTALARSGRFVGVKASVYLETTIASYLAAHRSRDLIVAANQELTHEWWIGRRERFELFVSQVVLDEAAAGDAEAARRRLQIVHGLRKLDV